MTGPDYVRPWRELVARALELLDDLKDEDWDENRVIWIKDAQALLGEDEVAS
jgi:hypothetical protein